MIPSPLVFAILCLAAYRLTRLAGWDDFPLAAKLRALAIGERWIPLEPVEPRGEMTRLDRQGISVTVPSAGGTHAAGDRVAEPDLPGKQPSSEVEAVRPAYDRPTLAHLIHCPFCVGFWISTATYAAWVAWNPVLYGLIPFAISGVVGLLAKNLDA